MKDILKREIQVGQYIAYGLMVGLGWLDTKIWSND